MIDGETPAASGAFDLGAIADTLRGFGYDIEPAQANDPPGASLVARRDRGERAIVVAIDAGGRFRVEMTWLVGEWPSETVLGDVPTRVVDSVSRAIDAAGQVATTAQMAAVIAEIEALAP